MLQNGRRFAEALEVYREALAIKERTLPPQDPNLSFSHDGIGQCLLGLGRAQDAVNELELALALRGNEPVPRADTRFALARALWELGKERGRARELATQAQADYQAGGRKEKDAEVERWLASHPMPLGGGR